MNRSAWASAAIHRSGYFLGQRETVRQDRPTSSATFSQAALLTRSSAARARSASDGGFRWDMATPSDPGSVEVSHISGERGHGVGEVRLKQVWTY